MIMDSVDFALRISPQFPHNMSYPLSLESRLAQGDQYREAKQTLELRLQEIIRYFLSPERPPHDGPPTCRRCRERKDAITQAFHQYYRTTSPSSWSRNFQDYQYALDQKFIDPNSYNIDEIQINHLAALCTHIQTDICSTLPPAGREHVSSLLNPEIPLLQALPNLLQEAEKSCDTESAALFFKSLQETTTPEQRGQLFTSYYCEPNPKDNPEQKAFKQKYAAEFSSLSRSPTEIVLAMRAEAQRHAKDLVKELDEKLSGLELAESAHLKALKKKAEKQRMREESLHVLQECGLARCGRAVDLAGDGGFECAVCEWVGRRVGGREEERYTIYCSGDHVKEDFDEHDRNEHSCCMGDHCLYYPDLGPTSEEIRGGICQNCAGEEIVSYFCSQKCYARNLETHREEIHVPRRIQSDIDMLDIFSMPEDVEMEN